MVLFLALDVGNGSLAVRLTHRENGVVIVPTKETTLRREIAGKFRGNAFDLLHKLCNGDCGWDCHNHVHVIRHPTKS